MERAFGKDLAQPQDRIKASQSCRCQRFYRRCPCLEGFLGPYLLGWSKIALTNVRGKSGKVDVHNGVPTSMVTVASVERAVPKSLCAGGAC